MTARDDLVQALLGNWTTRTALMSCDELIKAYEHQLANELRVLKHKIQWNADGLTLRRFTLDDGIRYLDPEVEE